ncbi:ABC-2 transporter permease [Phenylobacterium sp.]|uniref:ABC-2 transporter permease n=1 Tax=Phenylobacterium sp. TaxID=1871053 RepID=UPI00286C9FE3|nr:ABC-2 transporter permease [Phenylobacterium sp.]
MSDQTAPAAPRKVRPFYWSVRRELWENRSIYIAPAAIAAVVMFGFLISTFRLPHNLRAAIASGKDSSLMMPYAATAFVVLATSLVVAVFYCLGALQNERRDRSILFWKSLPVSDRVTVLSKAAVPMIVLPLVGFTVILASNLIMLAWSTIVVLLNGIAPWELWSRLPLAFMWLVLAIGLPFLALWFSPVFAWLILVSAWARRMAILWALGPPMALAIVERMAFGTSNIGKQIARRLTGGLSEAFSAKGEGKVPVDSLSAFDPGRLPVIADLWIGVAIAALLLFAAIRLRRSRDPI